MLVSHNLTKTYQLGQIVDEPVYAHVRGAAPVLLLARGQRINSAAQVQRLREAGYQVLDPSTVRVAPSKSTETEVPIRLSAAQEAENISARTALAKEHRGAVQKAARQLMHRVSADEPMDLFEALEISSFLVMQVAADPVGLVALTTLRGCDDYTIDHSADAAILMVAIAYRLGWSADDLRDLAIAGLVHDVGKQRLGPAILEKPGPLNEDEMALVRQHPKWSAEYIAQTKDCPKMVLDVALRHHERMDGKGYPFGLRGDEIDCASRIAAVANVFDAMTSNRCYRPALGPREALRQIFQGRGNQFDETVVDALVKLVGVFPIGTEVMLSNGERATVIHTNPDDTTRPIVLVTCDRWGLPLLAPRPMILQGSPITIREAIRAEAV